VAFWQGFLEMVEGSALELDVEIAQINMGLLISPGRYS
jgi:hypothetical protein